MKLPNYWLPLGYFTFVLLVSCQPNSNLRTPKSGYNEFDLEGGYLPGSIITSKGRVTDVIIGRDWLLKRVVDPSILELTDPIKTPETKLNRTQTFKAGLNAKGSFDAVSPEIKSILDNVHSVEQTVKDGERFGLSSGNIAFKDLIGSLPVKEFKTMIDEIGQGKDIYFVTEVIQYKDAENEFFWNNNFDIGANATIKKILSLYGTVIHTDSGSLVTKYTTPIIVKYKGRKIRKKDIDAVLKSYEEKGEPKVFYRDKDSDGYGNGNSMRLSIQLPNGYVENNQDCDDNNANINPTSVWYQDEDRDGYGNPRVSVTACSPPARYVANRRDCYDQNSNVFPGQNNYFQTHRGDGSFDYNCNGRVEKQWTAIGACNGDTPSPQGWLATVPEPGVTHSWLGDCDERLQGLIPKLVVVPEYNNKIQGGR